MATETERKFLVRGEFKDYAVKKIEIVQTYLTSDPTKTIRIRTADREAYMTIKTPVKDGTISRGEWEFPIPYEDALELMQICIPGKVIKTRYIIPVGKHNYEVDEFHDKNQGLIIAEIELDSDNEDFVKPAWLGKEVTGDPRYYNSNLIK